MFQSNVLFIFIYSMLNIYLHFIMLHFTSYTLKKSFLYSLTAIAVLIYIYLNFYTYSEPIFFVPSDSGEYDNLSDNIMEHTKESISRDRIKAIRSLKKLIKKINKKQSVKNQHLGPEITLIIAIQVHDKKYYLQQLIDSLQNATVISKTLIIFSHSYYDKDINSLVKNVTFAKVMQIFFPYSVQLHPLVFPGDDHKICDDLIRCRSGNRDPLAVQAKHHWWWSTDFIFNEIRYINDYNASVLFLEEDQYVTQDFIFVLKVLERLVSTSYPNCDIITLGGNNRNISHYNQQHATVTLKPLGPSDLGIVINRPIWDTMKSLAEHFCRYNDNRWMNSLNYLARKSSEGNFLVLSIDSPRVLQFSGCVNINGNKCHMVESVERVNSFVKNISKDLYPQNIVVREIIDEEKIVPNGEWHDARDQELCLFYTSNLEKSQLMV